MISLRNSLLLALCFAADGALELLQDGKVVARFSAKPEAAK